MCHCDDEEEYIPNEFTRRIPIDIWRKFNMGVEMSRDQILEEREKTHGKFQDTAQVAQRIKSIIQDYTKHPNSYCAVHMEALDMIASKIARILSGSADVKDHWIDIAGYAKLGEEACE